MNTLKYKRNMIILIAIIIIIVLVSLLIFNKDTKTNKENKIVSEIKNKIDNKEDILLYLTYKDNYDYEANRIIDYLKDLYKLDITYVDLNKITEKEKNKIISFVDERKDYIVPPAIIFIKDGKETSVANDIIDDLILNQLLFKNGYIEEKDYNIESIVDDNNFKEVYSSTEYNLIFIGTFIEEFYDYRKKLHNLANKNNFNYYLTYWYIGKEDIQGKLSKDYGKEIQVNSLVVVKDNKVIDNLEYKDIDKLEEFLKKYSFIK